MLGPAAALAVLAAVAVAGCDTCPYTVDSLWGGAFVAQRLDLAEAARAEETLDAMGYAGVRDGLRVTGEKDDLSVLVTLDGNGTRVAAWVDLGGRDFPSQRQAERFVEEQRADAEARINATIADFLGRMGWTAAHHEPFESAVSVC